VNLLKAEIVIYVVDLERVELIDIFVFALSAPCLIAHVHGLVPGCDPALPRLHVVEVVLVELLELLELAPQLSHKLVVP